MYPQVCLLQYKTSVAVRFSSSDQSKRISTGEASLVEILKQKFPKAKYIEVQDISGMYSLIT